MATYKMIQDIEAEDKILGPLTLRQFIFGLITAFLLYICFIIITKHVGFLLILFLPPAIFTGFFAFPFGRDQPTEVWALAKLRFLFKPRKRIWDQSGVKELVTITVPKRIEHVLTNGLNQNEVESRLRALANTIDSRGWAIKNVNVNLYSQLGQPVATDSDRLVSPSSLPQQVPDYDIQASDDILDETSNPIAQQFDQMINASSQAHRQQLINQMNDIAPATPVPVPATPTQSQPVNSGAAAAGPPADYWFLNQPTVPANLPADQAMFTNAQLVQPGVDDPVSPVASATLSDAEEAALTAQLKAQNNYAQQVSSYSHLRTIQPLNSAQPVMPTSQPAQAPAAINPAAAQPVNPSPDTPDAAILSLANNNDLNVATLAREAYKVKNPNEPPQDEVVISLH